MTKTSFFSDLWRRNPQLDRIVPAIPADGPSDADFRLLADHMPALCWIADGDGAIVWFNRRWLDYTGKTPGEVTGWGWECVHEPSTLAHDRTQWGAALARQESFEIECSLRGADGVYRPFLTRVQPVRDASGAVVRWFGVNTEIGAQERAQIELEASRASYAVLTNAMPQMVWSTRPDGFHDFYNDQWYSFTGVPAGSTDGEGWNDMFHPEDQERAWEKWRHSLETGEPYEIEYRLKHRSGDYRWTLGRALPVRDEDGTIQRWIGTCTDIHDAKLDAENNEILSRELSHRIKNIFSIIAGLIGLSARRDPTAKAFARDISDRIAALGRAHEFARPHSERSRPEIGAATLTGLLEQLFRPYAVEGETRIAITGDDPAVDDKGATPLALLFHELATNAAKYGGLSVPEGRVAIDTRVADDRLHMSWRESGGPAVAGPPAHVGFGTRLTSLSVEQQLGGQVTRMWEPGGLRVEIDVPLKGVARG